MSVCACIGQQREREKAVCSVLCVGCSLPPFNCLCVCVCVCFPVCALYCVLALASREGSEVCVLSCLRVCVVAAPQSLAAVCTHPYSPHPHTLP